MTPHPVTLAVGDERIGLADQSGNADWPKTEPAADAASQVPKRPRAVALRPGQEPIPANRSSCDTGPFVSAIQVARRHLYFVPRNPVVRRKSLSDSFSFPAARYRPGNQFARLPIFGHRYGHPISVPALGNQRVDLQAFIIGFPSHIPLKRPARVFIRAGWSSSVGPWACGYYQSQRSQRKSPAGVWGVAGPRERM